jgi:hypothetical protein
VQPRSRGARRDAQCSRRLLEAKLRPGDEEQDLAIAVCDPDERGGETAAQRPASRRPATRSAWLSTSCVASVRESAR